MAAATWPDTSWSIERYDHWRYRTTTYHSMVIERQPSGWLPPPTPAESQWGRAYVATIWPTIGPANNLVFVSNSVQEERDPIVVDLIDLLGGFEAYREAVDQQVGTPTDNRSLNENRPPRVEPS
jgi:hypothetical protein